MDIRDLLNSMKVTLHERATSPFWVAFIASWLASNYRLVMLIFDESSIYEKFVYIDRELYAGYAFLGIEWGKFLHFLAFPVLAIIFIFYLLPVPALILYEHWRKERTKLKEARNRIDNLEPLTAEDAIRIREDMLTVERERQDEREGWDTRMQRYKQQIKELESEVSELKKDISSSRQVASEQQDLNLGTSIKESERRLIDTSYEKVPVQTTEQAISSVPESTYRDLIDDGFTKDEIVVMKALSEFGHAVSVPPLSDQSGLSRLRVEKTIGTLEAKSYVERDIDGDPMLSDKGKSLVLSYELDR